MKKSILKLTIAIALATSAFAANAADYTLGAEQYLLDGSASTNSLLVFNVNPAYRSTVASGEYTSRLELSLQNPLPVADGNNNTVSPNLSTWLQSDVTNTYTYTFKMITTNAANTLVGTFIIDTSGIESGASSETKTYNASSTFTTLSGSTGLFSGAVGTGGFQIKAIENLTNPSLTVTVNSIQYQNFATFSTPTAPIPEADASAMLLMGAGIMGFIARRRKNTNA